MCIIQVLLHPTLIQELKDYIECDVIGALVRTVEKKAVLETTTELRVILRKPTMMYTTSMASATSVILDGCDIEIGLQQGSVLSAKSCVPGASQCTHSALYATLSYIY